MKGFDLCIVHGAARTPGTDHCEDYDEGEDCSFGFVCWPDEDGQLTTEE